MIGIEKPPKASNPEGFNNIDNVLNINKLFDEVPNSIRGCFGFWGLPEPGYDCETCSQSDWCHKQTVREVV